MQIFNESGQYLSAFGSFGSGQGQLAAAQALIALRDGCLLYTSDAADERSSVDLGGRRTIKKKTDGDEGVSGCVKRDIA